MLSRSLDVAPPELLAVLSGRSYKDFAPTEHLCDIR
jgi:hypothetical protein